MQRPSLDDVIKLAPVNLPLSSLEEQSEVKDGQSLKIGEGGANENDQSWGTPEVPSSSRKKVEVPTESRSSSL